MYHVFLGAPSVKDIDKDPDLYHWDTITEEGSAEDASRSFESNHDLTLLLPPATIEAASRRISLIYHNIIFLENNEEEKDGVLEEHPTTLITWPLTAEEDSHQGVSQIFFRGEDSTSRLISRVEETQESSRYTSDTSSMIRFPTFHFDLHRLTSLSSRLSAKINVLLAVFEVDGPDSIRLKKGKDAGKEISLLKMILGDEDGNVCKLTAWREVADQWGNVKRGDVVFLENVTASYDPKTSPTLLASPFLNSKLEVCYRTMPYTPEDMRYRPDLRLGGSDACVRKVAAVVQWFERMAGL